MQGRELCVCHPDADAVPPPLTCVRRRLADVDFANISDDALAGILKDLNGSSAAR